MALLLAGLWRAAPPLPGDGLAAAEFVMILAWKLVQWPLLPRRAGRRSP
ncbi:hypothetical protein [Dactylosporangium cerinum]